LVGGEGELNLPFGRVRRAFEAQQSFVADAAHELRSPLAALKVQAQSIPRASDDAARAVAVRRLTAGIDRATRLVEQLLVLERQQATAATGAKRRRLALSAVARLAVADAASSAQARRIGLGLGTRQRDVGHARVPVAARPWPRPPYFGTTLFVRIDATEPSSRLSRVCVWPVSMAR
jgi:two-component system OmpR family sensor kinase